MRALPRERPETLTAPPDGQVLEDIIGELQSTWGVPPYPQEYRITIKVAEEKDNRSDTGNGNGDGSRSKSADRPPRSRPEKTPAQTDGPRREKAPAAPGLSSSSGPQREKAPRKKRRRRRRGGGGGGADPSAGGSNPPGEGRPPEAGPPSDQG